jgi:hypothetical protein
MILQPGRSVFDRFGINWHTMRRGEGRGSRREELLDRFGGRRANSCEVCWVINQRLAERATAGVGFLLVPPGGK